nr:hypothetical protein [Tanacetum cinerariifolium]
MAMRTQLALPPGLSAKVTEVMILSPILFRKRMRVSTQRVRRLHLRIDSSRLSRLRSSRSTPDQQIADDTPTPRLPICTTWEDPKDASLAPVAPVDEDEFLELGVLLELNGNILYDHTECLDALPPTLIEGHGWDFTELFASTARMAMRTQLALPPGLSAKVTEIADTETESDELEDEGIDSKSEEAAFEDWQQQASSRSTPDQQITNDTPTPRLPIRTTWEDPKDASLAPVAPVDEDDFLELGVQLELNGNILYDHTECLDALPPTLIEGYGWDFTKLFARYEDQREIHDLRMQRVADQRELQELREHVTTLERRMDCIEE